MYAMISTGPGQLITTVIKWINLYLQIKKPLSMKAIVLLFLSSILILPAMAQKTDFDAAWNSVRDFEKNGLTQSASQQAKRIFDLAVASHNEPQQLKAAMYEMKYNFMLSDEEAMAMNYNYIDSLVNKTKAPAKNILLSMQAEYVQAYKNNNRFRLYNRTALENETGADIHTWSLKKLNAEIEKLYNASLQNTELLKNTPITDFDDILDKGKTTVGFRPTLYDFLVHRALDYFMNTESDVSAPNFSFLIDDENAFANATTFVQTHFKTKDSSSLLYHALILFQDILRFHLQDKNTDALIDADIARINFVYNNTIIAKKDILFESALQKMEHVYAANPMIADAMFARANLYFKQGKEYNPVTKKEFQFKLKEADALCQETIAKYPGSTGAQNCYNLEITLHTPSLGLVTENVNVSNLPFRTLVEYKNLSTIYLRIIKTSYPEWNDWIIQESDKSWKQLLNAKVIKSWSQSFPNPNDLQNHAAEIKIDGLPNGMYVILASQSPNFELSNNFLARQLTYISDISYILNSKNELYVLNRTTGEPIDKAQVQLWTKNYNSATRKYEYAKTRHYETDKNGLASLATNENNYYDNNIQINYKNDELHTLNQNYLSRYSEVTGKEDSKHTFFFTDRSIYRPGQILYFKGIVVTQNKKTGNSSIVPNYKTHVILYDANRQKVKKLFLQTNDYGSYHGSFQLPEAGLNGKFYIFDTATKSKQYFSVEEYKRPKFAVEIQKPTGSYRVNDSIHISGNAKAYAGNTIDGAKVSYRVVRKTQYPVWWGWGYRSKFWPPFDNQEEMEITNGITTTGTNGMFEIQFKAIPDETISKEDQPIFYYEVSADVTDINGETRSASSNIAVSYQSFQLNIALDEKIPADSLKNIKIRSINGNGIYEPAQVKLSMYPLNSPNKMFRERYWDTPDQFVMSKEEYYSFFPYDAYANEDLITHWGAGPAVMEINDSSRKDGSFKIKAHSLKPGWYKLIATSTDKYGEEVRAEKFICIMNKNNPAQNTAILVDINKKPMEPGETVSLACHTGFDKIWLIQKWTRVVQKMNTSYTYLEKDNPLLNQITISEADRGGIYFDYAFVKNNRVYHEAITVPVPWSNKQLQVKYETFRDNLLPGSQEKWKIKITGPKADKVTAETLISMYDASLDQFNPHQWASLYSLWPLNTNYIQWDNANFSVENSTELNRVLQPFKQVPDKVYNRLLGNVWLNDISYSVKRMVAASSSIMDYESEDMPGGHFLEKSIPGKVTPVSVEQNADTNTEKPNQNEQGEIQVRKNFNETAFFFPDLVTDKNGDVEFSFTIPEALTKWKMMTLAYDKTLASVYDEKTVITQKPLMVQPFAPRFFREGDQMEFTAKIVNLEHKELTGIATLELIDAKNNKPVDGWFKNIFPNQYFTVAAGQSTLVKFPIGIPSNFNSAMLYRIKAVTKDGAFSDGEEMALPVLSKRMLVTESMPLNMRHTNNKNFTFQKLLQSGNSSSLSNQSLTVEYTSNPAWYAVQALPYLMEYPYDCVEQNFNRYYANVLASYISNSTPKIKAIFDQWKNTDSSALLSNLQKNEELKSALLQETPWVLQAKNEQEQKKNIGLLFDMVRMAKEKTNTYNKLNQAQLPNGGFAWFTGGRDDRYMTQYILTGIGHLIKLNALQSIDYSLLKPITDKGLVYLDERIKEDYDYLVTHKIKLNQNNLSYIAIQYLYMNSFFEDHKINDKSKKAYQYYFNLAKKYWLPQSKYMQAMIALTLYRKGELKTAHEIMASLKENAVTNAGMGTYWKEFANRGYYWYQAPVESQALMIEAFSEVTRDDTMVDDVKTWLLTNKQTNQWNSTKATAEACYALLLKGSNWLTEENKVTIQLGNTTLSSTDVKTEAGTGYFKQNIPGEKVQQGMGHINVKIDKADSQSSSSSWGAVYWQYFEDLDKITTAETPLTLVKKLYVEKNTATGPVLQAIQNGDVIHVGDKIKVRIELRADRDMEYVHMKDMRASCLEPVNVLSSYKWQGGLGYYESTKDASTHFFFGWLPKGTYVFEYPLFVTHAGEFSNGITQIQCMYAPEFSSHSEGIRLVVE